MYPSKPFTARFPRLRLLAALPLLAAFLVLVPGSAHAAGASVSGQVTDGSIPVAGAFVAVTGPAGTATAISASDGTYGMSGVAAGSYTVSVQAPGYRATTDSATVPAEGTLNKALTLVPSGQSLRALPFYGAQIEGVYPGGLPGVFYARTSVSPYLFRTSDYGGHWAPVTGTLDDPTNGLGARNIGYHALAVSGFPGEIAVFDGNVIYYSTDFGVTWSALRDNVHTPNGVPVGPREVYWGHAGATSLMVVRVDSATYLMDMTAAKPRLVATTAYGITAQDTVTVANGADRPWIAVLATSGSLRVAALSPSGPGAAPSSSLTGLPAGEHYLLELGGVSAPGTPPSTVLGYEYASNRGFLAVKDAGDTQFSSERVASAEMGPVDNSGVPEPCGIISTQVAGSVAPSSGGAQGLGTIGSCVVRASGTTLTQYTRYRFAGTHGFAFDTGYGTDGDYVAITADGGHGLVKSAAVDDDGLPVFDSTHVATAGTAPSSGGLSLDGLTAPVVRDTTYGATPTQLASVLDMGGGSLGYASDDGGTTSHVVINKGGSAVTWWRGAEADSSWLVYGHGGAGNLLSGVKNWDPDVPALSNPNIDGTQAVDLGLGATAREREVHALIGVPGTDTMFVGMMQGMLDNPDAAPLAGSIARVTLSASQHADVTASVSQVASSAIDGAVTSLAYCPTVGQDTDVLYAGLARPAGGGAVVKIVGASGSSPAATVVPTDWNVRKIAAGCADGSVWAASGGFFRDGSRHGDLLRSTDTGLTYSSVPMVAPDVMGPLVPTAVTVNPADPSDVLIGANQGYLMRTTDAGASWTVLNNPDRGGRDLGSIVDAETPDDPAPTDPPGDQTPPSGDQTPPSGDQTPPPGDQAPSSANVRALSAHVASTTVTASLVGTGSGAFSATHATNVNGLYLATNDSGTWASDRVLGTGSSATRPAVAADAAGNATLVYQGKGGLYTSTRPAAGTWTAPRLVAGTKATDSTPVLRLAADGALHLAYARSATAAGIYYATKAKAGNWSAPVRVSTASDDSAPSLTVDASGKAHIVYRHTAAGPGLYYVTNRTGRWAAAAKVTGTASSDTAAVVAASPLSLKLAFVRADGIWTATKTGTHQWTAPVRSTTGKGDTGPTLATDAGGVGHLVFRRSTGAAGLYAMTDPTGRWSAPVKVAGTTAADTAPTVVTAGRTEYLVFARSSGSTAGVYLASGAVTAGWGQPARRSGSAHDGTPVLAVDGTGHVLAVFDRG